MLTQKQVTNLTEWFESNPQEQLGTVELVTTIKLNKKDVATKQRPNPFKEIRKVQKVNVIFNADYERRVNEARAAEGVKPDFEAGARLWGTYVGGRVVVKKDDELYFSYVEVAKDGDPIYVDSDMNPIAYDAFKDWVPVVSKPVGQGVEKEVKFRSVKATNIRAISFKGSDAVLNKE